MSQTEQEMAHPGGVKASFKDDPVPWLTRETPTQRRLRSLQSAFLRYFAMVVEKAGLDRLVAYIKTNSR